MARTRRVKITELGTAIQEILDEYGDNIAEAMPKAVRQVANIAKQETQAARQLYNYYHGRQDAQQSRQRLETILQAMTPAQVEQLTGVAAAIAG